MPNRHRIARTSGARKRPSALLERSCSSRYARATAPVCLRTWSLGRASKATALAASVAAPSRANASLPSRSTACSCSSALARGSEEASSALGEWRALPHYATAKADLHGLTRTLAKEVGAAGILVAESFWLPSHPEP
jgi:NAD(P)-dependent dehydrogenase (short-subunit alcohol dehydrogenase family)